ncbi:MAG: hypothetical protein HRU15_10300 [Planctomycetes bacterium]|nr:hypothetical protein [Planctomycetota bacterium]
MRSALQQVMFICFVYIFSISTAWAAESSGVHNWRNGGTSLFPKANPALKWNQISAAMKGMRNQAEKPKGSGARKASALEHGIFKHWMVSSALRIESDEEFAAHESIKNKTELKKIYTALLDISPVANESTLEPVQKVKKLKWKKLTADDSLIDFSDTEGDLKAHAVYAHTYFYVAQASSIHFMMEGTPYKVWLDGKEFAKNMGTSNFDIVAKETDLSVGWHRLLIKVLPVGEGDVGSDLRSGLACFRIRMESAEKDRKFTREGIQWSVNLPQVKTGRAWFSTAHPLIIGDKLIVHAEPYYLYCLDKNNGKILWVSYNGYYESVTDEERQKKAKQFSELDPSVKRIKEILKNHKSDRPLSKALDTELGGLERKVIKLMFKVNPKKYKQPFAQEPGVSGLTSIFDGEHIFTWFGNGTSVCHDLNGKRKWLTVRTEYVTEENHGWCHNPILAGDEFIVTMQTTWGLDKKTGAVKWQVPYGYSESAVESTKIEGSANTLLIGIKRDPRGRLPLAVHNPKEGLLSHSSSTIDGDKQYLGLWAGTYGTPRILTEYHYPTPFTSAEKVIATDVFLPKDHPIAPFHYLGATCSVGCVLAHDDLLYLVSIGGVLTVVEKKNLQIVYQKRLPLDTWYNGKYPQGAGIGSSPCLAGKYICIMGSTGTCAFIKPGRTYELVSKNKIEAVSKGRNGSHRTQPTLSMPIFEDRRMYYRADDHLYCIGAP